MIFGCLFVILAAFLVLMAGLYFLNVTRKEPVVNRFHIITGWSAVIFSILVIAGIVISGIVHLACGKCGHQMEKHRMHKMECSGYSGATQEKMGCGIEGMCDMKNRCGMDMREMHEMHEKRGMMKEMHIRTEGDSIEKEVVIIRK